MGTQALGNLHQSREHLSNKKKEVVYKALHKETQQQGAFTVPSSPWFFGGIFNHLQ